MLFQAEHLKDSGVCAFCGRYGLEGEFVGINGNEAVQKCHCRDCGEQWHDKYVLEEVESDIGNMPYKLKRLEGQAVCPYCGSPKIEERSWDIYINELTQSYTCRTCGESWQDKFVLSDIKKGR